MNAVASALAVCAAFVVAVPAAADGDARRDPFAPFDSSTVDEIVGGTQRCSENVAACAALDDVVVRGIISGTASPRVMVELKNGQSAVLRVGDLLGKGRIKAIRRTGVVVERTTFSNVAGTARTLITLPLG